MSDTRTDINEDIRMLVDMRVEYRIVKECQRHGGIGPWWNVCEDPFLMGNFLNRFFIYSKNPGKLHLLSKYNRVGRELFPPPQDKALWSEHCHKIRQAMPWGMILDALPYHYLGRLRPQHEWIPVNDPRSEGEKYMGENNYTWDNYYVEEEFRTWNR